jgi:hypothetical protein
VVIVPQRSQERTPQRSPTSALRGTVALQGMRDSGVDLTEWIDYFVSGLVTETDELTERGKHVIKVYITVAKYGLNATEGFGALPHVGIGS